MLGERGTVLTQLTEGLSAGQLWQFVKELAARLSPPAAGRDATGAGGGWGAGRAAEPSSADISRSALELLPSFVPLSQEAAQELREWTALVYQPLPPEVRPPPWAGISGCGQLLLAQPPHSPASVCAGRRREEAKEVRRGLASPLPPPARLLSAVQLPCFLSPFHCTALRIT